MSVGVKQLRQLTTVLIASPPGLNDDALQNYKVGSLVYSISDQTFYECSDATIGAAVWGAVSFGGGGSLQDAYDASTNPEIVTDATLGALTVRRGSAADTDDIYEGQNGAGTRTFGVDGNGTIFSDALTASRGVLADANKDLVSDGIGETRAAYLTTPQAVTSASETDITSLVFSVAANKKYIIDIACATECSGTGGIQFGHKFPTVSTFKLTHSGRTSGPTALINLGNIYTANTGLIPNTVNTSASPTGSYVASCLLVTTNSGNYQLTFASVSGAQTSTIREYSHIKITEVP